MTTDQAARSRDRNVGHTEQRKADRRLDYDAGRFRGPSKPRQAPAGCSEPGGHDWTAEKAFVYRCKHCGGRGVRRTRGTIAAVLT